MQMVHVHLLQWIHIHVQHEPIYLRIVQHVQLVHVDINVQDEHLSRNLIFSEDRHVEHENGQVHDQVVVVI